MKSFKRKQTFQNLESSVPLPPKIVEATALNLIELRRDKLILNEEAIQSLKNIKEDLIIVFIFGKKGTGKSFLMNLLIDSENKKKSITSSLISSKNVRGFMVNSLINSVKENKKGIYFWSSPIQKENSDENILFFDSEGIDENLNQQTLESKLLALMIIISSLFIYNSKGDINSDSLNDLQLLVKLTDSIKIKGMDDNDEIISELCPKFIWTLRDFDPDKYEEIKKKRDSYLEECLNDDRFKGKNRDEINMINENLLKYFKKRECIILPCPTNEEKELKMLKRMNLNELNENFQNEFHVLKKKIYETSQAKMIFGKKINGPILVDLLKYFIREINKEKIPNIDKIFTDLVKKEIKISYDSAKSEFKKRIELFKKGEDIDIKEIYHIKYDIMNEYMKILDQIPEIYNKDNYMKEFEETKERLENEIEKEIKTELVMFISEYSYDKIFEEKEMGKQSSFKEMLQDYLNMLIEFKVDMSDTILSKKDFGIFITNDIKKTNEIIDYIKNGNNIESDKENEEKEMSIDDDNLNNIKKELEKAEKEELELIGTYTQLLEKKEKIIKNSLKISDLGKHSIRTYSSKLVTFNMVVEKPCELSREENNEGKCNCNLNNAFENCIIF